MRKNIKIVEKICAYPECLSILSQYNKDKFCYVHQRQIAVNKSIEMEFRNSKIRREKYAKRK